MGRVVSSAPSAAPSSRNCTPTTPTLSRRVGGDRHRAGSRAPSAGAVIETVGGVVSGGGGAEHRGVHIGLDFGGAQRAVVDPDLVDQAAEELAPDAVAADAQRAGRGFDRPADGHVAGLHAIDEDAQGGAVVSGGQVGPGVQGEGGACRAVSISAVVKTLPLGRLVSVLAYRL